MSEKEDIAPDPTLPDGRVTMRDVAEYVGKEIKKAKDDLRADARARATENRLIFITLVAQYQLHLNLAAVGIVGAGWFTWTRLLPRLPFLNR